MRPEICGDFILLRKQRLRDCSWVRSITIFDRDPERMEKLKQSFNVKTAARLEEILQSPAIKLVFITASNNVHKELTIAIEPQRSKEKRAGR